MLLLSRFEFSTNSISIQINFEFSFFPPTCYIHPKSLEYRINVLRIALSPAIDTKKRPRSNDKNALAAATGTNVSIIAYITKRQLLAHDYMYNVSAPRLFFTHRVGSV